MHIIVFIPDNSSLSTADLFMKSIAAIATAVDNTLLKKWEWYQVS